ncbi:DJ-1/PfpI family protein [Bradyrhizobium sp. CB1717]|uniref:DJ-1/PfpI family protein n=1 Tax=Bradyrhizobium sp. CB1717 TaxID=3039154 RepID=UPI0024B0F2E4|nr:DJ-1/PfpI family protein [Bradyrhizobium sp. CB1717]WFU25157.1 DJ-1/PfpI family protein [Bradyrhizobium sp. CB1717]
MAHIGVVAFDGMDDLDFVGVACVLQKASELVAATPRLTVISCLGIDLAITAGGLRVNCEINHGRLREYDALVFPGGRAAQWVRPSMSFQASLREATQQETIICSVCSGAFILAGCGLLSGRKVAIHADKKDALALAGGCIPMGGIVRDGKIWSIGGQKENVCPKSIVMGFLILEHFHPAIVGQVRRRLEIFSTRTPADGLTDGGGA